AHIVSPRRLHAAILASGLRRLCRVAWRLRRLPAIVCGVAMLTNCAVGPDFRTPDPPAVTSYLPKVFLPGWPAGDRVPDRTVVRTSDIPDRWWGLFQSRYLNKLVEEAIAHNADLESAEAAVRVAQANALAQRGALFPVVVGSFNSSRQKIAGQSVTSNAASGADIYSLHTGQVTVSFVPDVFGGTRRQIEAADALVDLQAFQREGIYLTLTSNVALAAIEEASLRGQIAA